MSRFQIILTFGQQKHEVNAKSSFKRLTGKQHWCTQILGTNRRIHSQYVPGPFFRVGRGLGTRLDSCILLWIICTSRQQIFFYLARTFNLSTKTFLTWSSTAVWPFAWRKWLTLTERLMFTQWAGERKKTALLQRVAAIFAKQLEGQRST